MRTRKIMALVIIIVLLVSLFAACSADSITLNTPSYSGEAINGKPEFKFTWSKVADVDNYQIALYAEGDGFAVRSTKNIFNATEASIVFLQGVYTDTVRYRIKVGPSPAVGEDPPFFSNIYEINFVDGVYTVSETPEDFDDEVLSDDSTTTVISDSPVESLTAKDVSHELPEKFMDFMDAEEGYDISLDNIASIDVNVNYDMYSEPTQHITDEETIKKVKTALEYMTITDKADDNTGSTETYYSYSFADSEGSRMFSFIIQDGFLLTGNGRYNIDGLPILLDNSGIKLEKGWDEYWENYYAKVDEYDQSNEIVPPVPMMQACGFDTNEVASIDPSAINSITCYVEDNENAGKFYTTNPEEIAAVMSALQSVSVVSEEYDPKGQMWQMSFMYNVEGQNFPSSAILLFEGDCVDVGDGMYKTEGLDGLFSAVSSEVFDYLSRHKSENKVDPVY